MSHSFVAFMGNNNSRANACETATLPLAVRAPLSSVYQAESRLSKAIKDEDLPTVVALLLANPVVSLQIEACRFIAETSESLANRRRLGEIGACKAIVLSMRSHRSNADLQHHGCDAIFHLCKDSPSNIVKFGAVQASEEVVSAMHTHLLHADVQHWGLKVLTKLMYHNPVVNIRLGEDACHSIVSAMRSHLSNNDVQHQGCYAIGYFSMWKSAGDKLEESGACEAVLEAMRSIPSADIQRVGCWALVHLCSYSSANIDRLLENKACEVVTLGVKAHESDVYLQKWGKRALAALLQNCHMNE